MGRKRIMNIIKTTLLAIPLTAMCLGICAQGKINILNDANHLVYWNNGSLVTAADGLRIDLYGYVGTGAGSLALLTSTPMNSSIPGVFGPYNWNSPFPGGVASTFQVRVFIPAHGIYWGQSSVFTMQPGGSIAYNSLFNPGGTTLSTWATGTQPVAGGFGAVLVDPLPEPSNLVLAGFGAVSLLMFRRRK